MIRTLCLVAVTVTFALALSATSDKAPGEPSPKPTVITITDTSSQVVIARNGKRYQVNFDTGTVKEVTTSNPASQQTPESQADSQKAAAPSRDANAVKPEHYTIGDVRMVTLPTTKTVGRHGMLVDFTHRFPFNPAFSGPALGHMLLGLDSFAIPSFGFDYGLTDRISVGVFRSPTIINRPIEFKAGIKLADEDKGQPLNALLRFTVAGQNDFTRDYTETFELIASKSLGSRAQLELVPTVSLHNRPISFNVMPQPCGPALANGFEPALHISPCSNTFSIGVGLSVDIRPTVALMAEVDPTAAGGAELGIHHAPYSFGIQKKIWRHAFTFGFANSPGVTAAQRIFPRSVYLQDPTADKPSALFIGFNLSRVLR